MPAKNSIRVNQKGTYSHIYNRGIDKRVIFKTEEDYKVFLGFLKDYLTPPPTGETAKKSFTVNGRIFHGVPHQPKNYFSKVELVAYSLMPDHFHLLLHQNTPGSLQRFLRSLCTRYSMYYNKKHNRSGALFEGPYKSVQIKGVSPLLQLTRYIHRHPIDNDQSASESYTSYEEYQGARSTSWIKPDAVLDYFKNSKNKSFKGVEGYKNFVEKYQLEEQEKKGLEGIVLESMDERLERRVPKLVERQVAEKPYEEAAPDILPSFKEFAVAAVVFVALFTFGLRNINAINAKKGQSPMVSGASSPELEDSNKFKKYVIVSTEEGAKLNIRKEPMVESERLGEARNGEVFDFVAEDSGWYEVKLQSGKNGFISSKYSKVEETH